MYAIRSYYDYTDRALQMLTNVLDDVRNHARYFSHWASLLLRLAYPTRELAICGPDTETFRRKLEEDYWPHLILAGSEVASDLPLLKGRAPSDGTRLYVCEDKACQLPVEHLEEALATLHSQASPS